MTRIGRTLPDNVMHGGPAIRDTAAILRWNAGIQRARREYRRAPITSPSHKCTTAWCSGYGYRKGACGNCERLVAEVRRVAREIVGERRAAR